MMILNQTRSTPIAKQANIAKSFRARLVGLLGHRELKASHALVIQNCNSIHMFFMRFAIDAIFVDHNNRVVGLIRNIKPFRLSPIFFRARDVIECPVGTIEFSKTQIGDLIEIRKS